ncbi:Translation initiation factor IF-2 [Clarias magur]|uniref:Translation initiation factor IF-2 n=1 Tax=Clarias magur TaxID=1594786 RepID=A0A8J4T6N2_CLAMG|nr:Translation initiation factor IF-2 [Clarias magur]
MLRGKIFSSKSGNDWRQNPNPVPSLRPNQPCHARAAAFPPPPLSGHARTTVSKL